MKKSVLIPTILSMFLLFQGHYLGFGIDVQDTKLLSQPALSETQIAFVYAGDLWVADINGENVRRLTSDEGSEMSPVFSPDGRWIAFSAQYDGNIDVFIVPATGGIPKRLTWHPGPDIARSFTTDGSAVLFISNRDDFSNRFFQLFTVSVDGGFPNRLEIPKEFLFSDRPPKLRLPAAAWP